MADYLYTECGLDNVVIVDMDVVVDDEGEETFYIPYINALHRCIAHAIASSEISMSPKELRFLRSEMGYTQSELAELIHKDGQSVGRWERNDCPIDLSAEVVIRMLAAEKLELDLGLTLEDLTKQLEQHAEERSIVIDGSDPSNYRRQAA